MILNQAVGTEAADAVQLLACLQGPFRHGDDFTRRPREGSYRGIGVNHCARDGRGQLNVRQVEGRVEHVERPVPELVVGKLGALVRILLVNDDESTGVRRGADGVVHNAAVQHGLGRQELGEFSHIGARRTRHAAFGHMEPGGVGEHRGLHGQLGRIGKGSHFAHVLIVLARELALRLGRAVVVDHAFDVAGGNRLQANRLAVAHERHGHTRFIAVGVRQDDAGFVSLSLENRPDERIQLGVDQHDRLAMLEGIERHARAEFHRAGDFDDDVNRIAAGEHSGIFGDDRHIARNTGRRLLGCVDRLPLVDARFLEGAFGILSRAVRHAGETHARDRGTELQGNGAAGRTGAHDAHPNRAAVFFLPLQDGVDGLIGRSVAEFPIHDCFSVHEL